jgi:hypothetical protein
MRDDSGYENERSKYAGKSTWKKKNILGVEWGPGSPATASDVRVAVIRRNSGKEFLLRERQSLGVKKREME